MADEVEGVTVGTKPSWMLRKYNIKLIITSQAASNWTSYLDETPFEASPEEAQRRYEDFRAKIASIVYNHQRGNALEPLTMWERQHDGQLLKHFITNEGPTQQIQVRMHQCIIPQAIVANSFTQVMLIEV